MGTGGVNVGQLLPLMLPFSNLVEYKSHVSVSKPEAEVIVDWQQRGVNRRSSPSELKKHTLTKPDFTNMK